MLVISRKYQEAIRIGNDIRILVIRTGQRRVKLGIEGPHRVVREELESHASDYSPPVDPAVEALVAAARRARAWLPQPSTIATELTAALEPFERKAVPT